MMWRTARQIQCLVKGLRWRREERDGRARRKGRRPIKLGELVIPKKWREIDSYTVHRNAWTAHRTRESSAWKRSSGSCWKLKSVLTFCRSSHLSLAEILQQGQTSLSGRSNQWQHVCSSDLTDNRRMTRRPTHSSTREGGEVRA